MKKQIVNSQKFLVALPIFSKSIGFCHQTILARAKNKKDCISLVKYLRPNQNIGDIKQTYYY